MGGTFEIVHIRTPAVQHEKLTKTFFRLYINGSTPERKINFVKIFVHVWVHSKENNLLKRFFSFM